MEHMYEHKQDIATL